jgi:hypothetical protein
MRCLQLDGEFCPECAVWLGEEGGGLFQGRVFARIMHLIACSDSDVHGIPYVGYALGVCASSILRCGAHSACSAIFLSFLFRQRSLQVSLLEQARHEASMHYTGRLHSSGHTRGGHPPLASNPR